MTRHAKASTAASSSTPGAIKRPAKTDATRVASSDAKGTGAPSASKRLALVLLAASCLFAALATSAQAAPPAVTIQSASSVAFTTALAKGTVDPADHETSYHFDYITEAHFQENLTKSLPGFQGAGATGFGNLAEGAGETAVQAPLGSLSPNTTYHLRLFAENNQGEHVEAIAATFTTKAVAKPTVTINPVTTFTAHSAQLSGQINPNSPEAEGSTSPAEEEAFKTTYRFQCNPACPGLEEEHLAADNTAHPVSAEASGLHAGLLYHVELIASNAGGQQTAGPITFTTEALPPSIDATFATEVGEAEATVNATINPGGAPTTVHFDYITAAQFEADGNSFGAGTKETPESTSIGSNDEDQPAEAELNELEPNTAYRYRVVATNVKSPTGTPGPAKAFHTTLASSPFSGCANEAIRRQNNSTALPDCRAYEMVSPMDKGGLAAFPKTGLPAQISPDGEKVAYLGYSSFPGAGGNSALYSAHLGTRTPSGWQNTEQTPAVPQLKIALKIFLLSYAFSEDLTQTVISVPLAPLTPEATPGVWNLFLRHPGGEYSLVNAATPAVSAEEQCPGFLRPICFFIADVSAFAGGSTDFSHLLFESSAQLTPDAPEQTLENPFTESLYESFQGQVHLVGILPDGHTASNSTAGAGSSTEYTTGEQEKDRRIENAISADGSRVIFSAPSDEGTLPAETGQAGLTQLYDRIEGQETIELSAPNPGASPESPAAAPATFWAASKDGSRVFFTSAAELTTQSKTGDEGGEDLYEYDFGRLASERVTDLTPEAAPHGARVLGVVNPSADGSYVYFVAKGQLDGSKGTDGQPNLYMSHAGAAPVFIATLNGSGNCQATANQTADSCDWTQFAPTLEAYVTPDGRHLAFMSRMSLPTVNFPSGYDNTDQNTGEADAEVYEWSAESGELLCGSCDPSGGRPLGFALIGGTSYNGPGGVEGRQRYGGSGSPFNRPSALSENGARLFYTAPTSSGKLRYKVFEYEAEGEGSCSSAGGCQYLISDPAGEQDEQLLGTAGEGRDVFFSSANRLVPGDEDNLSDVYDAREEGGFAVVPPTPPCEGEGCRGSASTRPSSPATVTNTFSGREEGPRHPRCGKGQVKRHGRCLSRKHSKKAHKKSHKRAANSNRGGVK